MSSTALCVFYHKAAFLADGFAVLRLRQAFVFQPQLKSLYCLLWEKLLHWGQEPYAKPYHLGKIFYKEAGFHYGLCCITRLRPSCYTRRIIRPWQCLLFVTRAAQPRACVCVHAPCDSLPRQEFAAVIEITQLCGLGGHFDNQGSTSNLLSGLVICSTM